MDYIDTGIINHMCDEFPNIKAGCHDCSQTQNLYFGCDGVLQKICQHIFNGNGNTRDIYYKICLDLYIFFKYLICHSQEAMSESWLISAGIRSGSFHEQKWHLGQVLWQRSPQWWQKTTHTRYRTKLMKYNIVPFRSTLFNRSIPYIFTEEVPY